MKEAITISLDPSGSFRIKVHIHPDELTTRLALHIMDFLERERHGDATLNDHRDYSDTPIS